MKSDYEHVLDGDIEIGGAWLDPAHVQTNIEIIGKPRHGKSTLTEWLLLEILKRQDVGILHLDPTGDSYRKIVGWVAEGRIDRPVWLVDLDEAILRYNPIGLAKRDPAAFVPALYSALALIKGMASGHHQQMERWVQNTIESLIALDMPLSSAQKWLIDSDWRSGYTPRLSEDLQLQWRTATQSQLASSVGWFDMFSRENLKPVFSGDGFDWFEVYPKKPIVLVNLGCQRLGGDIRYQKTLGTLFLIGLFMVAQYTKRDQRVPWYLFIDDANDYTPEHMGPMLVKGTGHYQLNAVLIHHTAFGGELQRRVENGCGTKFYFAEYDKARLPRHTCAQTYDDLFVQYITLERTPKEYRETDALKKRVYSHPWYGEKPREEPPRSGAGAPRPGGRAPDDRPPGFRGAHQKSKGPGPRQDRRGK